MNKRIWIIIGVVVVASVIVGVVMAFRNTGQSGATIQGTSWEVKRLFSYRQSATHWESQVD